MPFPRDLNSLLIISLDVQSSINHFIGFMWRRVESRDVVFHLHASFKVRRLHSQFKKISGWNESLLSSPLD